VVAGDGFARFLIEEMAGLSHEFSLGGSDASGTVDALGTFMHNWKLL
jgi:hypothetical protein